MSQKKNIALFMLHLPDLSGGGGAERFFADLFEIYNSQENSEYNLFMIIDDPKELNKLGKLTRYQDKILSLSDYRYSFNKKLTDKIPFLTGLVKQGRTFQTQVKFKRLLQKHNIGLVHVPLYVDGMYDFFSALNVMPQGTRPKLAINIVDCRIPFTWFNPPTGTNLAYTKSNFDRLVNKLPLDGVFSWYENFEPFARKNKIFRKSPVIRSIKSRFTTVTSDAKFSEKENTIIFAHRLDEHKNPMFFLNAIDILMRKNPQALDNWKIKIFGKGPLQEQMQSFIEERQLKHLVSMDFLSDLKPEFERSKCFVSTQDLENFPSLSMAEAMVCGNAVIARNVGQTHFFVKNGQNGYLTGEDTPEGLAAVISEYLESTERHEQMGEESKKLIQEVHNAPNFILQIDSFWKEVLLS